MQQSNYQGETASVIALDRRDEEGIVLRFLMDSVSWDVHAREVRLTRELAQQLATMLEEELAESSRPHNLYGYSQPLMA